MIRTISTASLLFLLGGCITINSESAAPKPTAANLEGGCEGIREHFPFKYHGGKSGLGGEPGTDTADTVGRARRMNAAYKAACP